MSTDQSRVKHSKLLAVFVLSTSLFAARAHATWISTISSFDIDPEEAILEFGYGPSAASRDTPMVSGSAASLRNVTTEFHSGAEFNALTTLLTNGVARDVLIYFCVVGRACAGISDNFNDSAEFLTGIQISSIEIDLYYYDRESHFLCDDCGYGLQLALDIYDSDGNKLIDSRSIDVRDRVAVPEPPALFLIGTGLLGTVLLRRRRRAV